VTDQEHFPFHPAVSSWFAEAIGSPTEVQRSAWRETAQGHHVLVTAPTGNGKTLAAFLWAVNQLITGAWAPGTVRVLYVSPLKALNNDVRKNLLAPLDQLRLRFTQADLAFPGIAVQTRSGDTPGGERRRMVRRPPEILITTPESLNLLLSSRSGRSMLTGIATVILDEIHAVVGDKRGTHLITAVERLVPLAGEFQRIALSATVRPLDRVADFIGGFRMTGSAGDGRYEKRPVSVVRSREAKAYDVQVAVPSAVNAPSSVDQVAAGASPGRGDTFWPALTGAFREIIAAHRSTLLFANSRRTTEKVTRLLNEGRPGEIAYAHHGSLSREIRLAVEEKLKQGELKAIVATNSLELGIDIGSLDQVVLIQTPRSVSSALQRIGRSGHSVGGTSRGLLFPTYGRDLVDAAAMAKAVREQDIEEVRPVDAPLDVLAQVVLSMTAMEPWDRDALFAFLRTCYPYRDLPRRHYDLVLEMLAGRYAQSRVRELRPRVSIDRLDNTVRAREEVPFLLYASGGTIPERGYFDLRMKGSHAKIGELDEEFVWERSVGETFTLGAQLWRIEDITQNDVEVVPARSAAGIVPFWRAEEQNRDFHLSERIGRFLERADGMLDAGGFRQELTDQYALAGAAADALIRFLRLQRASTGGQLPHRHHLLIEHLDDPVARSGMQQVVLHTLWGGSVNRPFALALSTAWEERHGQPLQVIVNDDAVLLLLPPDAPSPALLSLVTSENFEGLLRRNLEQTGFFGARFRENAERALLLPKAGFRKRMPLWLVRLRSKKLFEAVRSFDDFPVLIETWRTCMQDEFDTEALARVLEELRDGSIRVSECTTRTASPFTGGLLWKRTNTYMYDDDTPLLAQESALRPDLVRELLFSSHLRPRIPAEVLIAFDRKVKRTAPGYAPGSAQELLDWVKERLLIPEPEWQELAGAIRRDRDEDAAAWLGQSGQKVVWTSWQGTKHRLLAAVEVVPKALEALGLPPGGMLFDPAGPGVDQQTVRTAVEAAAEKTAREGYGLTDLLSAWLAYYGPVERERVRDLLGIPADRLEDAVEPLIEARELVMDRFGEESGAGELCDSGNLEMLLRMARRHRQPVFRALPLEQLPLFLARYQGIAVRGESRDDLRQRIEALFGWPAAAGAWEEHLLPARMHPYRGEWLDLLMTDSDLLWFGCGARQVSLAFAQDLELFRAAGEGGPPSRLDALIPHAAGRYGLLEIAEQARLASAEAVRLLWEEAWKGNVTSDTFRAVRRGVLTGFTAQGAADDRRPLSRRSGFNRWKAARPLDGAWRRIDAQPPAEDLLAGEELMKDRVRQLLRRYGILFRELVTNELPLLQWRSLFRSLRRMELSGEVLSGHFFEGIPGLQFLSPEAFRMLQEPPQQDVRFWISAVDPASLCGMPLAALKDALPPRLASTHLVYEGSRLVLVSRRMGRSIDIRAQPDDPHFREHLSLFRDLLGREFDPPAKIIVEEINGGSALRGPYAAPLQRCGFSAGRTGLELWKEY
jgi:ATP-dependent helicase Lhr and Lhr-like helicase